MPASPRVRVSIYLILTFTFSSGFYYLCILHGMKVAYVFLLMWCPAIAALVTSVTTKRPLSEIGWRPGRPRYLLAGWAVPMVYSWPAYLVVWATGLGGFPKEEGLERFRTLLHMASTPTWVLVIVVYVLGSVVAVLFSGLSAAGEEIGWRGFLVPELSKFSSFTLTAVISGVIWSVWHMPLVLWSSYNSGTPKWYAVSCFAIMAISVSFVLAWLRLKSGSVWPAVLLHASHNAIIQGYLDALTINHGHANYFIGEFGCGMVPLTIACAWWVWRHRGQVEASDPIPSQAGS